MHQQKLNIMITLKCVLVLTYNLAGYLLAFTFFVLEAISFSYCSTFSLNISFCDEHTFNQHDHALHIVNLLPLSHCPLAFHPYPLALLPCPLTFAVNLQPIRNKLLY